MIEHEIKIPQIGDTPGPYELFEWLIEVGSTVTVGVDLFSMEIGKATMEVKSTVSGELKEIYIREGEVQPGDVVGIVIE